MSVVAPMQSDNGIRLLVGAQDEDAGGIRIGAFGGSPRPRTVVMAGTKASPSAELSRSRGEAALHGSRFQPRLGLGLRSSESAGLNR